MRDIDVIARITEDWLRLQERDRLDPPRSEAVRRVLARIAMEAPETAAACKRLLRQLSPAEREAVGRAQPLQAQAITQAIRAAQASPADSEVSVKEAAELMRVTPQAVRLAAAKGTVTASKRDGAWRIDRASAEAYRRQACP